MHTEQQFNFGITLDNGDTQGSDTIRELKAPPPKRSKSQPQSQSQTNLKDPSQIISTNSDNYVLASATHPKVCIATIFFKISAFFVYFFMGYVLSNVLTFIFTVILGSLDFWVVKNISGRLLVGLRWWTDYDEKGNQIWKFETHKEDFHANKVDRSFFWTSQIVGTIVWALLLIINILQLDLFWVMLIGINFGFYFTNLYGFYMCRGEHKKRIGNLKDQIGKAGLMHLAGNFI